MGLTIALAGLCVAGLASIVGIWMERDKARPIKWAAILSVLILIATIVSMVQSVLDARDAAKLEEDMARMIQRLDQIASASAGSDNAELNQFISGELQAQSRANPDIVKRLQERVEADGGDASSLLGKHMDPSDVPGGVKVDADAMKKANEANEAKLKKELAAETKRADDAEAALKAAEAEATTAKSTSETQAKQLQQAQTQIEGLNGRVAELEQEVRSAKKKGSPAVAPWQKG